MSKEEIIVDSYLIIYNCLLIKLQLNDSYYYFVSLYNEYWEDIGDLVFYTHIKAQPILIEPTLQLLLFIKT